MQKSYSSMIIGLLAATVALTACQKKQEPEPTLHEKVAEEAVPMSAEPADPNDTVIDPSAEEVSDMTVAQVEGAEPTQVSYVCNPELTLDVSYDDSAKHATLTTPQGSVVLEQKGDGAYEVATSLTGEAGLSQWRVSDASDTGVLRTSAGDNEEVTAYECKVAQ